jgi:hypothetical protein
MRIYYIQTYTDTVKYSYVNCLYSFARLETISEWKPGVFSVLLHQGQENIKQIYNMLI